MYTDIIFIYIIAAVSLVFAFANSVLYILKRNKTAKINGVIISIFSPNTNLSKKTIVNLQLLAITLIIKNTCQKTPYKYLFM